VAGENLIWTIGANTGPFRGELKLAQEQLKQLGRQISSAVKQGDVALAESLSRQYGTLEDRIVGANRALKGTAGALDQVGAATRRVRIDFRSFSSSIAGLSGQLGRLGGGFAGGLFGVAFGAALREGKQLLDDQIERITKIRDLARETARSPAAVAAAQNVGRAAGESEETVNKALQTQAANFAELEKRRIGLGPAINQTREAQAKQQELMQQRARLLGGGFFDASKDEAIDLSKVYEILIGNVARFKGSAEAAANFIDQSFLQIVKTGRYSETQLNEIAKALYGISGKAATKLATENIQKYNDELKNTKGATDTAVKSAEELAAAQGRASNEATKSFAPLVEGYTQLKIAIAEGQAQILKGGVTGVLQQQAQQTQDTMKAEEEAANQTWQAIGAGFTALVQTMTGGWAETADAEAKTSQTMQQSFKGLPNFFQGIGNTISDVWNATFGSIIGSAQAAEVRVSASAKGMSASFVVAAKDIQNAMAAALGAVNSLQGAASMAQGAAALPRASGGSDLGVAVFRGSIGDQGGHGPASFATQSVTPGLSDYQAPPPHRIDLFADGGMIRGPGTGTSDSIMARVSNGEFVMRAAAVRTLGAGFLSTLNRFAGGGMVMPSRGIPSFAGGGLVAMGGHGAVVNLVFPGGTFSLRGDNETVGALTREAQRAGMLAGGQRAGVL